MSGMPYDMATVAEGLAASVAIDHSYQVQPAHADTQTCCGLLQAILQEWLAWIPHLN